MEELEEALVIVKQRREEKNPELDFLHRVDEEQNKGCQCNLAFLGENFSLDDNLICKSQFN